MKIIITKEMFENFPMVDGIKQCPSGDYSQIERFAERCSFEKGCSFANDCSFAERCSFAEWCSFAKRCSFAKWCSFAKRCSFANDCSFAERCSFAKGCSFAEGCSFANDCSFAKGCSFANDCSFAKGCIAISPYWSFQYKPPFEVEGKIYPSFQCRSYWNERLEEFKIKFETECYDKIEEIITPRIPELLKSKKWTECERMILESWREK